MPLDRDALRGVRVLIVDDEAILASTFCLLLKHAGADAESVPDGRAALRVLLERQFDAIVTDKHMPEMSGPELIRELNRVHHPTPILLFVNTMEPDFEQELAELHIAGTLSKPLLPDDLIAALQRVVGRV